MVRNGVLPVILVGPTLVNLDELIRTQCDLEDPTTQRPPATLATNQETSSAC